MSERRADSDIQLVTFLLEGEEYAVDVMQVREIICVPEITPSHGSPPHVAGMISLRGNVLPVVSLRKKLGLAQSAHDLDTRIAVMSFSGKETGFILDRVCEVMRVKRCEIKPAADGMGQPWIAGILDLDKLIVVIDLEKLGGV